MTFWGRQEKGPLQAGLGNVILFWLSVANALTHMVVMVGRGWVVRFFHLSYLIITI